MRLSNFDFLQSEWPEVYEAAVKAEADVNYDPRAACFWARRALELAVRWLYKADGSLRFPYESSLSTLIHEPTFKDAVGETIFIKARLIETLGTHALEGSRRISSAQALQAVKELFHVGFWLAHTYDRGTKPDATIAFDGVAIPGAEEAGVNRAPHMASSAGRERAKAMTAVQLRELRDKLAAQDEDLGARLVEPEELDAEIERLRKEVAAAKKGNEATPDDHDYSEAATRDLFIDVLLAEAGWPLDRTCDREYEVDGMPNKEGRGFVDYVLWGDDGRPLALVEAKRTRKSAKIGKQQAKLYADALEGRFGRRPVIFYTNGYEHWLWDDLHYPPRRVQGFYTKDELELMIQRRSSRLPLEDAKINTSIADRYYQNRAIRRIGEAFTENRRTSLLVMATGAGKTRTVIALVELLMRCNWVKRTLFLADRIALVNQAVNAFKTHLPDSSPVNLVTDRDEEGRVYVSTYPTMMGLINELEDGRRRFGPGYFDLVVIDEAHRSVYQKYRAIFEYFDSLLVGLTATPKDEVDINTYRLFDLEQGMPTDAYPLDDAIKDGFLVPFKAVSVPVKFPREGIGYEQLAEEEKDEWDAVEWDEEGNIPKRVEPPALMAWLFNEDTVDKVLAHAMERAHHVAGGDRIGKTIIFAKNQHHAQFIVERFDANYPKHKGAFCQAIVHSVRYAQSLIDEFANPDKTPHIAVSVDMLDTGIDIPEVVNLVFFKQVHSKTKFWQMVGRGTRLRPDLFGPGDDKKEFYILDYCGNLEFFGQHAKTSEGRLQDSLARRLFMARLALIGELDWGPEADAAVVGTEGSSDVPSSPEDGGTGAGTPLRGEVADTLRTEVASMNVDNFIVRPKRRLVERYASPEAWKQIAPEELSSLSEEVAGLPSELEDEDEEAKRFDLIILRIQLAVLRHDPVFLKLRDQVRAIAELLEELGNIPMVEKHLELIQEIQSEQWWEDVTLPMLETVRKRLRLLVRLIEKRKRRVIYTDFEDAIGLETVIRIDLYETSGGGRRAGEDREGGGFRGDGDGRLTLGPETFAEFKIRARLFMQEHEDNIAVHRLRTNKPLTPSDLSALEQMLAEVGKQDMIDKAEEESQGLGLFVRSLVGMDRGAAKEAFAGFLEGRTLTSKQNRFVDMIIYHLTDRGVMGVEALYDSPFLDVAPQGPEDIFSVEQVDEIVDVLHRVRDSALAA